MPAISIYLLRVAPTIFLPIVLVRLAPLLRTLQADLPIHRIASDLPPMIIGAALALACGLVANLLLRMITVGLKSLPTVAATVMLHQGGPDGERKGFILSGSAPRPERTRPEIQLTEKPPCAAFLPMGLPLFLAAAIARQHAVLVRSASLVPREPSRLCGVTPNTESADLSGGNWDGRQVGCKALRNNTPRIPSVTRCIA